MSKSKQRTRRGLRIVTGNDRAEESGTHDHVELERVVRVEHVGRHLNPFLYAELDVLLSCCEAAEFPPNLAKLSETASSLRQALRAAPVAARAPEMDEMDAVEWQGPVGGDVVVLEDGFVIPF